MDELFGVAQLLDHKTADVERTSVGRASIGGASVGEVGKSSQAHVERVA